MIKLTLNAVGKVSHAFAVRDSSGSGLLPFQLAVDPSTSVTCRINGRVSPEAPWVELKYAVADFVEAVSWVPYIQLEVVSISGTGAVTLWIGEA